ncbi:MAG: RDD family protein [Candidatus Dadabacteria bacterium]|nr:RDD family protein [Candidatus Dadabacteria bacterium]
MKCPTCGYNSFDHLDTCRKCGSPLKGDPRIRPVIGNVAEDEYEPRPRARPEYTPGKDPQPDEFLDIPINEGRSPSGRGTEEGAPETRQRRQGEQPDLFRESEAASGVSNESVEEEPDPLEEGRPEDWLPPGQGGADRGDRYEDPFAEDEPYTEPGAAYRGREADEVYNLAGFLPRAAAFLIDIAVIAVIAYITLKISFVVAGVGGGAPGMNYLYPVLFLLASTYFIFLHALGGKTIGKMLMGIRLINDEGGDVGIWDAFLRWFGYFISAAVMLAGFFWAIFDSEGQAWHDKMAGTYVVKD